MDFDLMIIPIGLFAIFGLIGGLLAKRKQRNVKLWVFASGLLVIVALIGLMFFPSMKSLSDEQKSASIIKENIFCTIVIVLGVIRTMTIMMA